MATVSFESSTGPETFADLLAQLGGIPAERVFLRPMPGTATEADVLAALRRPRKRLCELVEGVLVEKVMGTKEGLLAGLILYLLWDFLESHDLGMAFPGDSPFKLKLGLVRFPDVCFISWDRLPTGELPDEAVASVVPNLTVEVISKGNTRGEILRKLEEYFRAGVQLVWIVYPKSQTAKVYSSPTKVRRIGKEGALEGGEVVPGFTLPLKQLFGRTTRRPRRR